jgi:hypothetical protein
MLNILLETVPILREVALMNPGNGKAFKTNEFSEQGGEKDGKSRTNQAPDGA